jgi:hypothetical protein
MIKYATRLPPGKSVQLLDDGETIRKIAQCSELKTLEFMKAVTCHFIDYPDPMVVPVYRFEILEKKRGNYVYSYDMMRLGILSEVERDLIDRIGDLHDSYGGDACYREGELYSGCYEYPELFNFLKLITRQQRYWDIHSGNILMDPDGQYRLIDLEGFLRTPLGQSCNNWISRSDDE